MIAKVLRASVVEPDVGDRLSVSARRERIRRL